MVLVYNINNKKKKNGKLAKTGRKCIRVKSGDEYICTASDNKLKSSVILGKKTSTP